MAITLITGTSTGIGLATAIALGRAGHTVYATMRNPARSPELQAIAAKEKLPITILTLDVDDDASVNEAVGQVLSRHGQIDVLVNNAGVGETGPVEELPLKEFRRAMETNFFGALRCIKAVLPGMREQRSGLIVNVTSLAGRMVIGGFSTYTASKFALEAASETLALEVKAFNIRVAIVEPGVIQTPIFDKMRAIPDTTRYPQERRLQALFAAALTQATPPMVVGEQIRQIVESNSWQLRYPVGPDAVPFLEWRARMTDEAWINFNATQSDEAWYRQIEQDFGLDARPNSLTELEDKTGQLQLATLESVI
jgi:NAD(P)-dependent dehydrogenase (short-subunit alcohol dehydrogenase family)